jgi:chaperonin GroEL
LLWLIFTRKVIMAKDIIHASEARAKILSGVEKLANVVAVTMGPQGRNVVLGKFVGAPVVTKDGVSVAREIVLRDPVEDLACQLVKEVAGRTADVAGDGTTTATVMAHEIISRGAVLMESGYSPLDFRDGLTWAVEQIASNLDIISVPTDGQEMIRSIATISANNDHVLGDKIAEAFSAVGFSGTVTAEASPGGDTSVRIVDGVELKTGYVTPAFLMDNNRGNIVIENCNILIVNRDITHLTDCISMLNDLSNDNKPLLILAKAIKQEALSTLVANNKLGRLKVVAAEIPMMGPSQADWLEDLSMLVGTNICSPESGALLRDMTVASLGFARQVIVGKATTKIIDGRKDIVRVTKKLEQYNKDKEILLGESERIDLKRRLSFLNSRAAVITVGYSTELELREKGDRMDDALSATVAAIEEGVVPGGGVALLRAASMIDLTLVRESLRPAAEVLVESCRRPISQILKNGFIASEPIISEILESDNVNFGFNAANNTFVDMFEAGVLDPKKVTRTAIENAASIALLLLNTESIVSEAPDDPSSWQPPAGWRPPQNGNLNHKY